MIPTQELSETNGHETSTPVQVTSTAKSTTGTGRRNLGRHARRRRKMIAAIEAAVTAHANGNITTASPSSTEIHPILPHDRNYEWPAIQEKSTISEEDKLALVAQLGYCPGNAISVVTRLRDVIPCHLNQYHDQRGNEPLVLKLYPLVLRDESDGTKHRRKRKGKLQDDEGIPSIPAGETTNDDNNHYRHLVEPFPTIFWVTHPHFKALISKIELQNRGTQLEKQLQTDPTLLDLMKEAHQAYGEERFSMITPQDHEFLESRRWDSALDASRGVAGIRNPSAIKCLHAHAAHYWSGCATNIVGQWVAEEVLSMFQEQEETQTPTQNSSILSDANK